MTLLEKAQQVESKSNRPAKDKKALLERCELALAYSDGRVTTSQVAAVTGKEAKQVAVWCSNSIAMGLRHRVISATLSDAN